MLELMEARVESLRRQLDTVNQKKFMLKELEDDIMIELLDTRRQILRATLDQRRENGS